MRVRSNTLLGTGWVVLCLILLVGCANNMRDGAKIEPYEPSTFFDDGQSSRPLVPNTVARGQQRADEHFYSGMMSGEAETNTTATTEATTTAETTATAEAGDQGSGGTGEGVQGEDQSGDQQGDPAEGQAQGRAQPVDTFPFPVTREVLERGQDRYNIYCAPCHAITGNGDGMIVQRGFSPPPTFHSDRLREAPVGHYFDVITNGFGRMYAYGARVEPADRWAIIAYIRALQLSQNATIDDVPQEERGNIQGATP